MQILKNLGMLRLSLVLMTTMLVVFSGNLSGCKGYSRGERMRAGETASRTDHTKTYYVSPSGKNSNPGTEERPWATPGYGSRNLKPGDTLVIRGGRYILSTYDEDILIPPSGTSREIVTIRGEKGDRPVLAGRKNLLTAIDLSGKNYVKIENIEITSDKGAPFRDAIQATGKPVNHLVLKDLYIHHVDEFGVNIGDVNDLKISSSKITHAGFGSVGGPEGQKGGWKNTVIENSYLAYSGHYYRGGRGPSPYDRPDGFGIEPSAGPVEIVNTIVENNRGDGIDSKAENTYIHHTVVANNYADGIKLWGKSSKIENSLIYGRGGGNKGTTPWSSIVIDTKSKGASFQIVNVTVDDSLGGNYLMYVQYDSRKIPVNLTIINSIFSAGGESSPIFLAGSVKLNLDHNLFYMPKSEEVLIHGEKKSYGPVEIERLGSGNRYGDPRFVRPGFVAGDYHLEEGSPAIDAGTSVGHSSTDLDNKGRPRGKADDIGAYEQ